MNVSFTEKQEKYIASQIQGGDYQNASELVRDAIRLHEVLRHKVIEDLRMEIEKGWKGQTSHRNVQSILEAKRRKRSS
ncbi:MAG: type II toxin-antitoxin system ParD family antitoxin [Cyclobacteriaceae bacterium]|jgi:antitoxin ParD1/3/4|nr:type II toxin-antitoxin system ParD family antitoxin [Cyclobacteriaceae bacterium]